MKEKKDNILYFAKTKSNAIIPSKRNEDAGYDIYACFDEPYMIIPSLQTKLIPTGIAAAISPNYYLQVEERGSTGSKGIKKSAGIIDSGYRDEIFVAVTNCTNDSIIITDLTPDDLKRYYVYNDCETGYVLPIDPNNPQNSEHTFDNSPVMIGFVFKNDTINDGDDFTDRYIYYPKSKAIAQLIVHRVYDMAVEEIPYEELMKIESERGLGSLGSSGK